MNAHVSKSLFKAKALEYMRQVQDSGVAVVITDRGQPTLEVRRYQAKSRCPLTILRGTVTRYERPFASIDDEAWEAAQ